MIRFFSQAGRLAEASVLALRQLPGTRFHTDGQLPQPLLRLRGASQRPYTRVDVEPGAPPHNLGKEARAESFLQEP